MEAGRPEDRPSADRPTAGRPTGAAARSPLTTHPVKTKADLREFIDLTALIADARGESDHVVPLFAADIAEWASGSGWFAEDVELWLVRDDSGAAVGRTLCHRSRLLAERLSEQPCAQVPETLFFGALEALDATVLDEIIALILDRADALGATRVFGPVSPLPNVTGGLVTAGFENPGFFDTAWNPEFVSDAFAAAGFSPWSPAQTWEVRLDAVPHARATAVTPAEWAEHGLRRRPVTRLGMRRFASRLLPTLNSAFSALPYFTQISPAQLRSQMAGLPVLADPALIVDVVGSEEGDDVPSRCFALVIPDPVAVLRRHGGRLGPAAVWDLLRHRSRLTDAVLIVQGTDPRFQGQGLLSLVTREVFAGLAAGGYRRLRVTFIAEDNPASAAVFANAGGTPLHSLCFLDRRLEPAPARPDPAVARAGDEALAHAGDVAGSGRRSAPGISASLLTSLFHTAARAPSAHNTQPWVPTVESIAADGSSAEVALTVDPDRTLPVGDPRSEDLHLSLGCWIEAFAIAASGADLGIAVASVDGWGRSLTVGLHVRVDASDPDDGRHSPEGTWPRFTVADLEHRQVDRGPLARDDPAFAAAVTAANTALAGSGARLVEVPDSLWSRLLDRAEHWSFSTPGVFAETLGWLRFDTRDPAYRADGLNAECLRIPPRAARAAGVLNRARLRPVIARALAGALAPVGWLQGRRRYSEDAVPERTGAPHHLVLAVTEDGGTEQTSSSSAGATPEGAVSKGAARELHLGRELLRLWLLLDRAGLRVDVHSEIKDCPKTHGILREMLDRGHPDRGGDAPDARRSDDGTGHDDNGTFTRPIAAFSVGRSTTKVPRSHRRPTD